MPSSLPPLGLYNHRQYCFCPVHSTATHVCTITASMMSSSLPPLCLYNHVIFASSSRPTTHVCCLYTQSPPAFCRPLPHHSCLYNHTTVRKGKNVYLIQPISNLQSNIIPTFPTNKQPLVVGRGCLQKVHPWLAVCYNYRLPL